MLNRSHGIRVGVNCHSLEVCERRHLNYLSFSGYNAHEFHILGIHLSRGGRSNTSRVMDHDSTREDTSGPCSLWSIQSLLNGPLSFLHGSEGLLDGPWVLASIPHNFAENWVVSIVLVNASMFLLLSFMFFLEFLLEVLLLSMNLLLKQLLVNEVFSLIVKVSFPLIVAMVICQLVKIFKQTPFLGLFENVLVWLIDEFNAWILIYHRVWYFRSLF